MAKCKITVLRKEFYSDLASQYLAKPEVGACSLFQVGQEFVIDSKDYWRMQIPAMPAGFCSEAWDALSKYIFVQLSGGVVMKGWTNDDQVMITCCNDGVRPVIFKLERIAD